ncbi:MAG: MT-A70 family methyltransferase [Acidiferrobacterales bacterium]
MKFKTLYADPPWPVKGGKNGKGGWSKTASPHTHYKEMTVAQIMALPVDPVMDPNSHLYLWVTNGFLPAGLDVMAAWGYRYVNNVVWGKTSGYGLGQYWRGEHEICLFGVRGKVPYARDPQTGRRRQARSLVLAPRTTHSAKPEEVRRRIEVVSPGPYLELFSRTTVPGWTCVGNQSPSTPGEDVKDWLEENK